MRRRQAWAGAAASRTSRARRRRCSRSETSRMRLPSLAGARWQQQKPAAGQVAALRQRAAGLHGAAKRAAAGRGQRLQRPPQLARVQLQARWRIFWRSQRRRALWWCRLPRWQPCCARQTSLHPLLLLLPLAAAAAARCRGGSAPWQPSARGSSSDQVACRRTVASACADPPAVNGSVTGLRMVAAQRLLGAGAVQRRGVGGRTYAWRGWAGCGRGQELCGSGCRQGSWPREGRGPAQIRMAHGWVASRNRSRCACAVG